MPINSGSQGSAGHQPGTPTIGTATQGCSSVSVAFTAPAYTGKPNTSLTYTATSTPSSITGTGSTSPITVSGLSNGTAYTFIVKLSNGVQDSLNSSSSNSATPNCGTTTTAAPTTAAPTTTTAGTTTTTTAGTTTTTTAGTTTTTTAGTTTTTTASTTTTPPPPTYICDSYNRFTIGNCFPLGACQAYQSAQPGSPC